MNDILVNPIVSLTLTAGIYILFSLGAKKVKSPLFNPLLLTSITIIVLLKLTHSNYADYAHATNLLTRLIAPATVCLAIPLYQNTQILKQFLKPILIGCITGVLVHALCISILSYLLSLELPLIVSLFPKSVTTAIAQDLSLSYGGNISITIPTVILTGITGASLAPSILKLLKIHHPIAKGLSLGISSHAVGTSKAIEMGELEGTMAGLALIITGLFTIVIAPFFMILLGAFL